MMKLYCCGCEKKVEPRLTNGKEVYPHSQDLYRLPFWKCDTCGNFVGCHHKTRDRTRPLGIIATPELKNARQHIHNLLDPLWKNDLISRKKLYEMVSKKLGLREYHTANLGSVEEAREAYKAIREIARALS